MQNEEEVIAVLRNALRRRMGDRLFDADLDEGREQNVSKSARSVALAMPRHSGGFVGMGRVPV